MIKTSIPDYVVAVIRAPGTGVVQTVRNRSDFSLCEERGRRCYA